MSYGELQVGLGKSRRIVYAPAEVLVAIDTLIGVLFTSGAPYVRLSWVEGASRHSLYVPAGAVVEVSYERDGLDAERIRQLTDDGRESAAHLREIIFDKDWNAVRYTPSEEEGSAE